MPRNRRRRESAQPHGADHHRLAYRGSPQPSHAAGGGAARGPRRPEVSPAADRLRRARESVGLSLDVLVLRTKISRGMLQAVEAMDLDRLPVDTYTRGFVLSYAREVGLDAEAMVADYLAELAEKRHAIEATLPSAPEPPALRVRIADLNRDVSGLTGLIVMLGCAAALILYVWFLGARHSPTRSVSASPPADAPADPASATPKPAAAPPDAVPAASPAMSSALNGPFRVELRADRECWVSATVDGRLVLSRLLRAGEHETLEVTANVVLRVGEPGALRYTINGHEGEPLGEPGQPVTVRITPANAHEFVS